MKTATKFSLVLILAGLTAAGINSFSQATPRTPPAAANHRLDRLAGAWFAGAAGGGQSFVGLITFSVDGIVHASATPMGAVAPYETPAYGNWVATGPNQAAYTFVSLFANPDGSLSATTKTVGKLQYDPSTDTWGGAFQFYVFDADGNEFMSYPGMISDATRIAVERLD
ncbi:MAG: hypothetical protein NT154_40595 [Verrucomicrobia bacterium]|nr:hypothetical protein [Verrucomicrobiota bacterium]